MAQSPPISATAPARLRVLVADDERLARQRIEDLLAPDETVEIVGTADNGDAAVEAIRSLNPDVVLLDVQMPGRSGLDVVRDIGPQKMPATIFITAYDQYALRAFDAAAIDYLMKPFDDERFEQAMRRARNVVELKSLGELSTRLLKLLQSRHEHEGGGEPAPSGNRSGAAGGGDWLQRIAVESRGQVRVVSVNDIEYITASGPYAELHIGNKAHLIRERMQALEEKLDPSRFFRVHRSAIVRLEQIETLFRDPGGDYAVRLKNGAHLSVSRGRIEALELWMGV